MRKTTVLKDLESNNVLLVDDDRLNVLLMRKILENRGFNVDVAYTGKDAFEKLLTGKYNVLLLDVMLPDISGVKLMKMVKNKSDFDYIPVIMITGLDSDLYEKRFGNVESDGFITKPLRPTDLINKINLVLRSGETI